MPFYQLRHLADRGVVIFEPSEDLQSHLIAQLRVSAEMVDALLVNSAAPGLSYIMQEHGQAKHFVLSCPADPFQDVLPNCIAVVGVVLRGLHTDVEFRQELLRDPCLIGRTQHLRPVGHKGLLQFLPDPLRADLLQRAREPGAGAEDMSEDGEQPESQDNTQEESAANDLPADTLPDNLYVDENGNMFLTTPEGETLRYTKNKDGTYDCPTESQSGARVNYNDGYDDNVRRITKEEDIKEASRVYKGEEQRRLEEQYAAAEARQKAWDEEEAKKDREWQAKVDKDNSELSQLSKEQEEIERRYWKDIREKEELERKGVFVDNVRKKYVNGDESVGKEGLMRAIKYGTLKRAQLENMMEGGYHGQEAAEWDD